jgi:hypothetical protein
VSIEFILSDRYTECMSFLGIPITSRYTNSVLRPSSGTNYALGDGITREFDLGPSIAYSDDQNYTDWITKEWIPAVVGAYSSSKRDLPDLRQRMKQYAQEVFSWKSSAVQFSRLFD